MKYFLHIGYDGTKFRGWQCQPDVPSVQETIEEKLTNIFKEKVSVYGCGRTDSGVHASQYMLHFNVSERLKHDLKFILNKHLPNEIAVFDVFEMDGKQHARYDATSRTYDYYIHLYKDPVLNNYSSSYDLEKLDFEAMKKGAEILSKYDDFKSLCRHPDFYDHTICKVTHAKLYVDDNQQRLRFTITANRFLRGMVRYCVSFLLKIGTGEISLEEFEHILSNKLEMPDKRPALPNGLYLSRVEYPYLKIDARPDFCSFLKVGLEDDSSSL